MGGDDPSVGISANNLGDALMRLGKMDEAIAHVELACQLFETHYGAEHPHTDICFNNLARVRHHQERSDEALATTLERALAIHRKAYGGTHPILAYHLVERGRILRDLGRQREAIAALESALKLRVEGDEEATLTAEARFELAYTLPKKQAVRALGLADQARQTYESVGEAATSELAATIKWLAENRN